jgi:hypothetical protein
VESCGIADAVTACIHFHSEHGVSRPRRNVTFHQLNLRRHDAETDHVVRALSGGRIMRGGVVGAGAGIGGVMERMRTVFRT